MWSTIYVATVLRSASSTLPSYILSLLFPCSGWGGLSSSMWVVCYRFNGGDVLCCRFLLNTLLGLDFYYWPNRLQDQFSPSSSSVSFWLYAVHLCWAAHTCLDFFADWNKFGFDFLYSFAPLVVWVYGICYVRCCVNSQNPSYSLVMLSSRLVSSEGPYDVLSVPFIALSHLLNGQFAMFLVAFSGLLCYFGCLFVTSHALLVVVNGF